MKRGKDILNTIADAADLNFEAFPGVPLVEIYDQKRVLIENHCGVLRYGCKEILIRIRSGCLRICGENLHLARMNKEQVVITGRIYGVNLQGRG